MEYGCIGEHLGHSFSKEIHGELDTYEYEIHEVARDELDGFMTERSFKAINVTIPYKEDVIPHLSYIDDNAKKIGAVNTIVNKDGKLYGYNTDFFGMSSLIGRSGVSLQGKKVLVLGTGGTSKTAVAVSTSLGASFVACVSRSAKNGAVTYGEAYRDHGDAEVIINATPSGMFPFPDDVPIDLAKFRQLSLVIDAIYNPLRTKLFRQAVELGIKAECGLYMLVAQAAQASGIFTGRRISESVIDGVYKKLFSRKENIVLIGMPGAGKTTVGGTIAKKLGRVFVDTDDEIVRETSRTPAEIIKTDGEAEFRRIESKIIAEKIAPMTEAVIATGGGAVLREENVNRLKQNGALVLLDRALDEITPTPSRPLSSKRESLEALYRERMPIYSAVCDGRIAVSADPESNAEAVIRLLGKDTVYENTCCKRA